MFTGLVETTGTITDINRNRIAVETGLASELNIGDSIAVNGACLTVTRLESNTFIADTSPETYSVTSFRTKKKGDIVNLERAAKFNSRIDGHLVYGHIDTTGIITEIKKNNDFIDLTIKFSDEYQNYTVKKGSVTIDGVSLTVANEKAGGYITIAVIPHTWDSTALKHLSTGSSVNIEFDIISKYIEKNLNIYHNKSRISLEFLEENGFA